MAKGTTSQLHVLCVTVMCYFRCMTSMCWGGASWWRWQWRVRHSTLSMSLSQETVNSFVIQ